jgi:phosphatidylserine decarboxylase
VLAAAVIGGLVALALALPLAWKWELGMERSAIAICGFSVVAGIAVATLDAVTPLARGLAATLVAALTLAIAAAVLLWRFYRDPERSAPDRDDIVISPADGVVIYLHRTERGELPVSTKHGRPFRLDELVRTQLRSDDAVVLGIALSFLDVHVNRAPIAGAVTAQTRYAGRFLSLKDPVAVYANQRMTTVVEQPSLQIAVVSIASRLVRRIVSFVREGDKVALGQRIGIIRFGSQVDLILPDREGVRVVVRPGQRVRAGETIVAELAPERVAT